MGDEGGVGRAQRSPGKTLPLGASKPRDGGVQHCPFPLLTSFGLGLTPHPPTTVRLPPGTLSLALIELAIKHQPGMMGGR